MSTAEFVYKEFKQRYPLVYIGRPSRFLETVRQIAAPIKKKRSTQKSCILEERVEAQNQKCHHQMSR